MSYPHDQFFKTPNKLYLLDLEGNPLRLLLFFIQRSNLDSIFNKHSSIAKELKLSISSIQRSQKVLEDLGYITVISGAANHRSNTYKVVYDKVLGDIEKISPSKQQVPKLVPTPVLPADPLPDVIPFRVNPIISKHSFENCTDLNCKDPECNDGYLGEDLK